MKKILILEDGNINAYEVDYDQEYMNVCLEEYRKKFSLLKCEKFYTDDECTRENAKNRIVCFDDVASFAVSSEDDESTEVTIIGAFNPILYNIFSDKNGNFSLTSSKISALMSWYEAFNNGRGIIERKYSEKNNAIPDCDDFYNLDEKAHIEENIKDLLGDVTFKYCGPVSSCHEYDEYTAKKASDFIKTFNLPVKRSKVLIKRHEKKSSN